MNFCLWHYHRFILFSLAFRDTRLKVIICVHGTGLTQYTSPDPNVISIFSAVQSLFQIVSSFLREKMCSSYTK